ncbi:MAG: B12-binding domain-containing radical SAM protein [Deltaproteobacteria bacterium]|nr:B12-binding domain-containing radical SAM protein [Deltaproteobacteria bacterium]
MRVLLVVTDLSACEQYGPMYLSALAQQKGCQTRFVRAKPVAVQKAVKEWAPQVVAWSAASGEFEAMAGLNDSLKKDHDFVSIFGGPHPTYLPESLFKHRIDYGVIGEGEGAFVDLLEAVANNSDGSQMANVVTPDKQTTEVRPLIADLDVLPLPDYHGFYEANPYVGQFPVKSFIPVRGCPHNCTYCFNHQFRAFYKGKGPVVRRASVGRVIEEVLFVKNHFPMELVRFNPDCFAPRRDQWLEEFCQEFPRKVGLPFYCVLNPNNVTEEIIAMLKEAGLVSVFSAIECGVEDYRRQVLKRNMSDQKLLSTFSLLKKYKINALSNSMIALPGTSFEDDLKTLELNQRCQPTPGVATIFQPYPKLKLTTYAIEHGHYADSDQSGNIQFFRKSVLDFPETVRRQQKNLCDSFSLLVRFPFLTKVLKPVMASRPLIFPFALWSTFIWGYSYQTKIFPHRRTVGRVWTNLKAAVSYFSNTLRGE